MLLREKLFKGQLFAYDRRVTIAEHLQQRFKPNLFLGNLVPTVGRVYILGGGVLSAIDNVKIGDDGSTRLAADTDLNNPLYECFPTDYRVVGTRRITELLVGTSEANFTHREIGIFAGTTLISTLKILPEFEKTIVKVRTYIHEMGWF